MNGLAPWLPLLLVGCGPAVRTESIQGETSPTPVLEPTPKGFTVAFSNVQGNEPDLDPPKAAQVYIKVVKYDPEFGKVEWAGIHRVGYKIGWGFDPASGLFTSKHRVSAPKRRGRAEVDFDTGCVLLEITPDQVVLRGSSTYRADEVVYLDPMGIWQWVHFKGSSDSRILESEFVRKAAKREGIPFVLSQADYDWGSKNPKVRRQAQEKYRMLLNDFPSESVVQKNRVRIKARSEAAIED